MYEKLVKLNPDLKIKKVSNDNFRRYGFIVEGYDVSALIAKAKEIVKIPAAGCDYHASVPELEALAPKDLLEQMHYGEMPMQIGTCAGFGDSIGALEYHKGDETVIAVTDCVILIGCQSDIVDGKFDTKDAEAFYVPAGTVLETYGTCLHYGPCNVEETGFITLVCLPQGTNMPLEKPVVVKNLEDKMLLAKNKWVICREGTSEAKDGAYVGIVGDDCKLKIK